MTEYSEKEKELVEWYHKFPKYSLNIYETERMLKKPLEYLLNRTHFELQYNYWDNSKKNWSRSYNFDAIESMKRLDSQYLVNHKLSRTIYHDGDIDERHIAFPVREAKGKWMKRLWLKYFH